MRYDDLLASVGGTPLVGLPTLSPSPDVRLWAKLEDRNPTGSIKDRAALAMIQHAEKDGTLRPGCTILEPTSGNTGISLAMVARLRGYRLVCVMPENTSEERHQLLRMWGAEVVSSAARRRLQRGRPRCQGDGRRASRLGDALPVRQPRQRSRPLRGHRPRDPRRPPDRHPLRRAGSARPARSWVSAGSSGSTSPRSGSSRPSRGTASWCTDCATSTRASSPSSTTRALIDSRFSVGPRDAVRRVRELLDGEGIFAGISTGAILHAALAQAAKAERAGERADIAFVVARRRVEVPLDRRLRGHDRRGGRSPRRASCGLERERAGVVRTESGLHRAANAAAACRKARLSRTCSR